MSTIYLAEITAAVDGAGTLTTLRYSSGAGYSHPSAPGYYDARIIQPANLRRTMFATGTTTGAVEVGFGELILANVDGALDALIDYGFDGRPVRLLIGDDTAAYSSFVPVLVGTMEQAALTVGDITIRLRDRLASLEARPASPNTYAGTNALPAGLEGTSDDIKGRRKVRTLGRVLNVSPVCVNTSRLIYQVHDGAVSAVSAVYDNGVSLTAGAVYASQADMETAAPAASNFRVWPAGGYFRLGSSPAGTITADVTQGAAVANRTAGQLLLSLAQTGGLVSGEWSASDVTALDAAAPEELGLWLGEDMTVRAAMERVASAAGAWFGFDRQGLLRMGRVSAPSGSPAVVLQSFGLGAAAPANGADILEVERLASDDPGRGVPAYRVTVNHSKNWTVQNSVAGSVTAARRTFLAAEYRASVATNAAVLTKHTSSPELSFDTLLLSEANASAEATRRLGLYGVRRDRLRVRVRLDGALAAAVDLGGVVSVALGRFGYGAGKLFIVTGIEYDAASNEAELELWG